MNQERVAFREKAEVLALTPANVDPVLRGNFHEIHIGRWIVHELLDKWTPQPEARARYRILMCLFAHGYTVEGLQDQTTAGLQLLQW